DHGLDAKDFHGPRIQEELAALAMYQEPARIHGAFEMLPQDREQLTRWLRDLIDEDAALPSKGEVLQKIVRGSKDSPLPELSALIQERITAVEPIVET